MSLTLEVVLIRAGTQQAQGGGGDGDEGTGSGEPGLEYGEDDDDEPTLPALQRLHLASPISFYSSTAYAHSHGRRVPSDGEEVEDSVFLRPGPRHNAYSFEEGYRDWLGHTAGERGCWKEQDDVDIDAEPPAPMVMATPPKTVGCGCGTSA